MDLNEETSSIGDNSSDRPQIDTRSPSPPRDVECVEDYIIVPPSKRRKYGNKGQKLPQDLAPCYLDKMPMEILAEILSHTASPRDILSLARCSKFFCATLTHSGSDFIWRRARACCQPQPIPDPTPNYTESAYAALIFDSGVCEICDKRAKMYWSFALKARLCDKESCKKKFQSRLLYVQESVLSEQYKPLVFVVPRLDRRSSAPSSLVRISAWRDAKDKLHKEMLSQETFPQYLIKLEAQAQRYRIVLKHARTLTTWRDDWMRLSAEVNKRNNALAATFAGRMRWKVHDLFQTRAYHMLHHTKTDCLELVTEQDIKSIEPELEKQMIENFETRKRRKQEKAHLKRREDVAAHYDRLRPQYKCLPTLSEFRQLPMMKVMQSKPSNDVTGIHADLQNSELVQQVLDNDLAIWLEKARTDMAVILGFPQWKSFSKKKLHPSDRLTARFKCKRCDKAAMNCRVKNVESLDFVAACRHSCPHLKKKKLAHDRWDAEHFEPDQQAINAVTKLLELCQVDPEDPESILVVKELGERILCLSCPCTIVFNFETLPRHCKRHEDMQIDLISETEVDVTLCAPFEFGLAAQLLSSNADAIAMRDEKIFGCRHCRQSRLYSDPTATTPEGVPANPDPSQPAKDLKSRKCATDRRTEKTPAPKFYTFNGLRSHLVEKHGVAQIGDEDFFRQEGRGSHTEKPERDK